MSTAKTDRTSPPASLTLDGRRVVVVGGGTGIGAGIAGVLATRGAEVLIGGRRREPLESVAESVTSPKPIRCETVDVGDDASVTKFFELAGSPLDVVVNCAGINIVDRSMAKMDPADWTRVMNINANGAYRVMAAVLPDMRARKQGLIINISSVAGKRALEVAGVVYSASKFAMTALGTAVSNEVRCEGVRVTNVYPGEVNTPILDKRPSPVSQEHRDQILQPEDIAAVVATLCELPPRAHVPELVIKPTTQEWL